MAIRGRRSLVERNGEKSHPYELRKNAPIARAPSSPTPASRGLNATDAVSGVEGRLAAVLIAKRSTASNRIRTIFAARRAPELRRSIFAETRPFYSRPGSPTHASRVLNAVYSFSCVAGRFAAVAFAKRTAAGNRRRTIFAKTRPLGAPPISPTPASRVLNEEGDFSGVAGRLAAVVTRRDRRR